MNKRETLNDQYLELLSWLEYEGKPSEAIWHPLFYTYPFGLRFELGLDALDDDDEYFRSCYTRGQRMWDTVFNPDDEVLLIFDGTPDKELKETLKHLRLQRVRAKRLYPMPEDEWEGDYFYRYLYAGAASVFPFPAILKRALGWRYGIYFYNRTKKLLFHPYDDRGVDLIGADTESLRPFYESLHDLLLDWDREEMARKFRLVRKAFIRVLTTTTDTKREAAVQEMLVQKFRGADLSFSEWQPYWKCEGWGECSVTMDTARPLKDIQNQLARNWESDTAAAEILLPDVGFLWVSE